MKVMLRHPNAKLPFRANPTDAGADLHSTISFTLAPGDRKVVDTGVAIELPRGTAGYVYARSGLGSAGLRPRNCVGVIDEKYRGPILITMENVSNEIHHVEVGDRIAQLVVAPVVHPEFELVEELDMEGDRGGGYGSTGK